MTEPSSVIKWMPFELHTHTNHSDGSHTLPELARQAKEAGYEGIALTDHSTMSGIYERSEAEEKYGIHIIRGMEWTTFYGHVLILGAKQYVDWRDLGPGDLHKRIAAIHEQNGIIGIAHPFRIGSPMCTGCFWDYTVSDWNEIDYIEVWSGPFPSVKKHNAKAFASWTDLLNLGYRLTAVSGRDWHRPEKAAGPLAATYLPIGKTEPAAGKAEPESNEWCNRRNIERRAIEALRKGAAGVSMGPLLLMHIEAAAEKKRWGIGEAVPANYAQEELGISIFLDDTARSGHWELKEPSLKVLLQSNLGCLYELALPRGETSAACTVKPARLTWVRAELHGRFYGTQTMIGFTNPIYFDR